MPLPQETPKKLPTAEEVENALPNLYDFLHLLIDFIPVFSTIVLFVAIYMATKWTLDKHAKGKTDWDVFRSITLFLVGFIGVIAVIYALPMSNELRSDVTSLLGIVLSGVLAFSSATFIGNGLAGILLRIIRNYKPGDFIECGEHFGRVTERGLFHTEIQTQDSDLTTIPNMFLASNPVKVKRSNGTIISGICSLGYDVNRVLIEETLIEAAKASELTDPFVRVNELGDFSVVYEVFGRVKDVKGILFARSRLLAMMLDKLHAANIEIVSPNFMNQKQVGETIFIPKKMKEKNVNTNAKDAPENLIFDKADDAQSLVEIKTKIAEVDEKLVNIKLELKTAEDKEELQSRLDRWSAVKEKLDEKLIAKSNEIDAKS